MGLDAPHLVTAVFKIIGFSAISLGISAWFLRGTDAGFLTVNFHSFMLAFQILLVGVFICLRGLGVGSSATQLITSLVGVSMLGTVLLANPAILLAGDEYRRLVIDAAVWANPIVVSAHEFLELDLFRMQPLYGFSKIPHYHFLYPKWTHVALAYTASGLGLGLLGVGLRLVLFSLPRRSRALRQERADGLRRAAETELREAPAPSLGPSIEAAPRPEIRQEIEEEGPPPDALPAAAAASLLEDGVLGEGSDLDASTEPPGPPPITAALSADAAPGGWLGDGGDEGASPSESDGAGDESPPDEEVPDSALGPLPLDETGQEPEPDGEPESGGATSWGSLMDGWGEPEAATPPAEEETPGEVEAAGEAPLGDIDTSPGGFLDEMPEDSGPESGPSPDGEPEEAPPSEAVEEPDSAPGGVETEEKPDAGPEGGEPAETGASIFSGLMDGWGDDIEEKTPPTGNADGETEGEIEAVVEEEEVEEEEEEGRDS